ncbi:MAG: hypothetical protein AAF741_11385 [Bacteroidota bacterium]
MAKQEEIRNLVMKARVDDALRELYAYSTDADVNQTYKDDVVLLRAQHERIKQDQVRGIDPDSSEINKISAAILEITGRIDQKNNHSKSDSERKSLMLSQLQVLKWNLDGLIEINQSSINRSLYLGCSLFALTVVFFIASITVGFGGDDVLIKYVTSILSFIPGILGVFPIKDINQKFDALKLCKRFRKRMELLLSEAVPLTKENLSEVQRIKLLVNKMQESKAA